MKKPRKRKSKQCRRALDPRAQATRSQAPPAQATPPARRGVFTPATVASNWLDLDDDRSAFALLAAPVLLMAMAIATNVSIHSKFRVDRIVPNQLQAINVAPAQAEIRTTKPSPTFLTHNNSPTRHITLAPVPRPDFRAVMRADGPGQTVANITVAKKTVALASPLVQSVSAGEQTNISPVKNSLVKRATRPGVVVSNSDHHQTPRSPRLPASKLKAVPLSATGFAHQEMKLAKTALRLTHLPVPGQRALPVRDANLLSSTPTLHLAKAGLVATSLVLTTLIDGDTRDILDHAGICTAAKKRPATPAPYTLAKRDTASFGLSLARAAHQQTKTFVIYNDKYISIRFPMGDVPALYGVCTDVVIRAYRTLGIDLQDLVYRSRIGSGDRSIDHRRTRNLKTFFERFGQSLPITDNVEDYRPGDIITYYRPNNRGSKWHIAIVANAVAPSGRPMIIHNRGSGPQVEDALFMDRITGHFRYTGPMPTRPRAVAATQRPATRPVSR